LKADNRAFFTACSKAQPAVDCLRGLALGDQATGSRKRKRGNRPDASRAPKGNFGELGWLIILWRNLSSVVPLSRGKQLMHSR